MFEMIVAMCMFGGLVMMVFNAYRAEKERKNRAIAHAEWANINRVACEKMGVFI